MHRGNAMRGLKRTLAKAAEVQKMSNLVYGVLNALLEYKLKLEQTRKTSTYHSLLPHQEHQSY